MSPRTGGISFVVPVHNGAATIRETLAAIGGQLAGRLAEIVVIDDRSLDASRAIVTEMAQSLPIAIVDGPGRGAAAAINTGLLAAQYPVVCQIDQDVVIAPGWVDRLLDDLTCAGRRRDARLLRDRADRGCHGPSDGARSRPALHRYRRRVQRPCLHGQHGVQGGSPPSGWSL